VANYLHRILVENYAFTRAGVQGMKIRGWPRSIRSQLLVGLLLLEALSLLLFGALLARNQANEVRQRAEQRLEHQASSLALQVKQALDAGRPDTIPISVRMMSDAPSVETARVSDPHGKLLYVSPGTGQPLQPGELAKAVGLQPDQARFFTLGSGVWEGVKAISGPQGLYGYAWVTTDKSWDQVQVNTLLRSTEIFGIVWLCASAILAWWMASSISRPLAVLHRGTRALMHSPDAESLYPLPVTVHNEIGELIEAFNRMVASIEEQRAGLSDTLSLLDSMLANAPIGLAFFDRRCRFVRVNRIFAEISGIPLSRHLGRTLPEVLSVLSPDTAIQLERTVRDVFDTDRPLRDREVTGVAADGGRSWTWIVSAYPIHTAPAEVRWAGLIVLDASDRKRGEEALRKTEKLAATGRLAASIAHEINNPLEAITNLLYLLSNHVQLPDAARGYVEMAEHEVRRISEITQQMLRFYRQSTLPVRANLGELVDSVLSLHHGRLRNLDIKVERRYDPAITMYCFAGEVRQVFANLVGNAIDAMPEGGRLLVRARRSQDWHVPERSGIRFLVADTGSGMKPEVREHIFEPFFTTKEKTGTGLGLWISSEIVAKHKGFMRVRSRTEADSGSAGTIFEIFFPDELEPGTVSETETQALPAAV
jgi:PAS domain S-box-containing protein